MATFFQTYNQVGKKEDVSDVISMITPTATPFQSLISGSDKVNNTVYQWQEDSLAVPGANAVVEGADAVDSDMQPTVMRSNYTQILQKTVKVSETADAIGTYGRAKETAMQIAKKGAELKRELEYALIGIAQNAAIGSSSVARTFGNVFGQDATSTALINSAVTVDKSATPAALAEADILSLGQKLYEQGADAKYIMIKPADSLIFAGFASASGRYRTFDGTSDKTIVNTVNLYVSPFGEQKVLLNRFLMADKALMFDPANWKLSTLRPWTKTPLAKTGDAHRTQIVGEFGLKHVNYKATGMVKGLTGSVNIV